MVDRELQRRIKRLKEFMQLWVKFHDMYKDAISRETITPKEEDAFLQTKSLIARKYQALKDYLGIASSYEDKTFDVISQLLSLKSVAAISDLSLRKIENDWHNSYILLNKLLGELEGKQDSLRKISRLGLIIKRLSDSSLIRLIVVIILIFAIYMAIDYAQKASQVEPEEGKKGKIEFRYNNK